MNTQKTDYPIANPNIVLREEFDDWAILFDPDTGNAYSINPTGIIIWKLLNGKNTKDEVISKLTEECEDISEDINKDVDEFIENLNKQGFIGHEL